MVALFIALNKARIAAAAAAIPKPAQGLISRHRRGFAAGRSPLNLPASFAIRGVRVLRGPGTVGLACAGPGPASILAVVEKSRSDVHHV
jgi:hypothetical protein